MLITTFGPPSGYTQCSLFLMRLLTDELLRDVDYLVAGELSQLREAWAARRQPHVFFFADCPERALVDVFLKLQAPSVIFLEDPNEVTGYIVRERGITWPWALRLTHQCLVSIGDLIASENALVLRREYELTLREFFTAIAKQFQIEGSEAQYRRVLEKADLAGEFTLDSPLETVLLARWQHSRPIHSGLDGIEKSDGRVIASMNAPLKAVMAGRRVDRFHWPQEMFICGDRPNDALLGSIDMLGAARCLCYGPYLHLPMGDWEVALEMEVRENLSGNRFDVDIFHGEVVALESFAIPAAGHFRIQAHFPIRDPREPVQVRIIMREGAIEGILEVKSASVRAAQPSSVSPVSG